MIIDDILLIIVCSVLGKVLHTKGLLNPNIIQKINKCIIYILLPAIIVSSVSQADLRANELLPLLNIIWLVTMAIIAIILCFVLKINRPLSGTLIISFCSLEGGSIGLILVILLAGTKYLPAFFLLDVTNAIMLFSFIYTIAYLYGGQNKFNFKMMVKFLIGPIPCALIIGVLLNITQTKVNPSIITILNAMGYLVLPLIMLVLGAQFKLNYKHLMPALIYSIVKIVIGTLIALACIHILKITEPVQIIVSLIISALPPSYLVMIFAQEQQLDTEMLSNILPISTILSFITIVTVYNILV